MALRFPIFKIYRIMATAFSRTTSGQRECRSKVLTPCSNSLTIKHEVLLNTYTFSVCRGGRRFLFCGFVQGE